MKLIHLALFPVLVSALTGCNSGTDTKSAKTDSTSNSGASSPDAGTKPTPTATNTDAKSGDTKSPDASPKGTEPTSDVTGTKSAGSSPTNAASKTKLPAELDTEGLEYLGFTQSKPIDIQASGTGITGILTGSQTVTLKDVQIGKATYEINRTGGLTILGTDTETAEKGGVFEVSSSIGKYSEHAMDMPASPKPGMTWKFHVSADQANAQMDMETTCRVVGKESVTTKAGTFPDALVVTQSGEGELQHQKARTEFKIWYVKGLGAVKAEQIVHLPKGKIDKLTLEVTKKP